MYNVRERGIIFISKGRREGEKESAGEAYFRVQKDLEKI